MIVHRGFSTDSIRSMITNGLLEPLTAQQIKSTTEFIDNYKVVDFNVKRDKYEPTTATFWIMIQVEGETAEIFFTVQSDGFLSIVSFNNALCLQ